VSAFSGSPPGDALPTGWQRTLFTRFKKPTEYRIEHVEGQAVLASLADASASLVVHPVAIDLAATPWISWRWRVDNILPDADNSIATREDSPARVIIGFEGDRDQLDFDEKIFHDKVKLISGTAPPFATLMYIWENNKATGSVINNVHTTRVKMIVAQSGADGIGQWKVERWNAYDDFKRAFNEEPPKVKFVAIMSDSDNTRGLVRAYFDNIIFSKAAP
jgi:Protein of unknown function (DUF3047)